MFVPRAAGQWIKADSAHFCAFGRFSDRFVLFDADNRSCSSGSSFQPPHAAASTLAPSKQLCITQLVADYIKRRLLRLAALAADLLINASFEEKQVCRGGKRRLSGCRRGFESAGRNGLTSEKDSTFGFITFSERDLEVMHF